MAEEDARAKRARFIRELAQRDLYEAALEYCPDEKLKARGTVARGIRTGLREPRKAA